MYENGLDDDPVEGNRPESHEVVAGGRRAISGSTGA